MSFCQSHRMPLFDFFCRFWEGFAWNTGDIFRFLAFHFWVNAPHFYRSFSLIILDIYELTRFSFFVMTQQAQLPLHQLQMLQSLQRHYLMPRTVLVTTQRGHWEPWCMTVSNGFSQGNKHWSKRKSGKRCWNWRNQSVQTLTMPPQAPSKSSSLQRRSKGA